MRPKFGKNDELTNKLTFMKAKLILMALAARLLTAEAAEPAPAGDEFTRGVCDAVGGIILEARQTPHHVVIEIYTPLKTFNDVRRAVSEFISADDRFETYNPWTKSPVGLSMLVRYTRRTPYEYGIITWQAGLLTYTQPR